MEYIEQGVWLIRNCCKEFENELNDSIHLAFNKGLPITPKIELQIEYYDGSHLPKYTWDKEIKYCPFCGKKYIIKKNKKLWKK